MILYFSGTGNSKYVAERIADALGDALVNLNDRIKASDTSLVETGERVIIVTPTYAWRIPRVVRALNVDIHLRTVSFQIRIYIRRFGGGLLWLVRLVQPERAHRVDDELPACFASRPT